MTRRNRVILYVIGGLTIFVLGTLAGGGEQPAPAATPTPTVTVTETVTQAGSAEVPQSCRDALTIAEEGFGLNAEILSIMGGLFEDEMPDALTAAAMGDAAGLDEASSRLSAHGEEVSDLTAQLDPEGYNRAKDDCLS